MKLLYNTSTQLFQPYPRNDDGEVIGLDPIYQVYTVNQDAEPSYDPATHHLESTQDINYDACIIHNGFNVVENPPLPAPEAERHKVMEFLMRAAIPLESIPALISSVTQEGVERDVALMRWHEVPTFPKNHPLVIAVAAELDLNLDAVWDTILAIE